MKAPYQAYKQNQPSFLLASTLTHLIPYIFVSILADFTILTDASTTALFSKGLF